MGCYFPNTQGFIPVKSQNRIHPLFDTLRHQTTTMIFKKPYCLNIFFILTCLVLLSGFTRQHAPVPADAKAFIIYSDTLPPKDTVGEEAYFPGGEAGWREFLQQNLNANIPVDKGAPAGKYSVMVQFVVDLDGKLSDFKALTRYGYGMEAEVLRILRKSPPWVPAVLDGQHVRAYRKQPVTFMVIDEKKKRKDRS